MTNSSPRVGLFVTCLVDLFRPTVGFGAVKLLEKAGCHVEIPAAQTCCGQPAYNSGDFASARDIARSVVKEFSGFDYVVAPSGSCAGMIKRHYGELLEAEPALAPDLARLEARTYELVSFLTDVMGVTDIESRFRGTVTYHDSCSGLRELGVKEQPRRLLNGIDGVNVTEMANTEVCCGFGGTFCVKYPDVSVKMVDEKTDSIVASKADTVLAGDMGCLLNIAGRLHRRGENIKARHVVEVLADMADGPAIGAEK